MEPVMLNFLATTENIKYQIKIRTTELQLREFVKNIQWEIAIRNFHRRKIE